MTERDEAGNRLVVTLTAAELLGMMEQAARRVMGQTQAMVVDRMEMAQRLGVSAAHVDNLRKRGLPTVMIGQAVRFEPDAVLTWLRDQRGENDNT